MTDANFQNWQREKYASALAALTPGTRDANLAAVALYGRRAGIPPEELYADIMANAPGDKRPNPSAPAEQAAAHLNALGADWRWQIYWLAAATLTACVTYTGGKA